MRRACFAFLMVAGLAGCRPYHAATATSQADATPADAGPAAAADEAWVQDRQAEAATAAEEAEAAVAAAQAAAAAAGAEAAGTPAPDTPTTPTAGTPPPEIQLLIDRSTALNSTCRGNSGDDPATLQACEARDALDDQIEAAGWCYGRPGDYGYQRVWQPCSAR